MDTKENCAAPSDFYLKMIANRAKADPAFRKELEQYDLYLSASGQKYVPFTSSFIDKILDFLLGKPPSIW